MRNWGIFASIVGLGTVGGGICYGLFEQIAYSDRAYDSSAHYAEYASDRVTQACLKSDDGAKEKANCLHQAASEHRIAARDKQREYEDLIAQQKSALWTMIMGIAALIGMAFSVVGIVLVWTTFRETRRAADAGHDANRPWVDIVPSVLAGSAFTWDDRGCSAPISVYMRNFGNSPATDVTYFLFAVSSDSELDTWIASAKAFLAQAAHEPITLFPNESSPEKPWGLGFGATEDILMHGSMTAKIIAAAGYRFSGSTQKHFTFRVYEMRWVAGAIVKANCPLESAELRLVPHRTVGGFVT